MYLMLSTRPDILYTVAALGRHTANPAFEYQHALDPLFWYLRGISSSLLGMGLEDVSNTIRVQACRTRTSSNITWNLQTKVPSRSQKY